MRSFQVVALLVLVVLVVVSATGVRRHDHYTTSSDVPGYRLGDAIQSPRKTDAGDLSSLAWLARLGLRYSFKPPAPTTAVVKAYPDSLATEYIMRSNGVPRNYDLLAAIVRRRWSVARPSVVPPPPPNTMVIHLRLGDVANRLGNEPQRVWAHGSLRHKSRSILV